MSNTNTNRAPADVERLINMIISPDLFVNENYNGPKEVRLYLDCGPWMAAMRKGKREISMHS